MTKYTPQSEANRNLAALQTRDDLHPGHSVVATPTHNDISTRAYDIYVKNGCKDGRCEQNWKQAEHEIQDAMRHPVKNNSTLPAGRGAA